MSNSLYHIRNYRHADFDEYALLLIEAEKLEPTGRFISLKVLRESLYRPNYSSERDLFIIETHGNVVGYMEVTPEADIGRIIVNCFILPDHRRKGLDRELLGHAMCRAKETGVKVTHINIPQGNEAAEKVLSRLDFKPVRSFLQLRLDVTQGCCPDVNATLLEYHHMQRGEEDKLAEIQNRSFAGTWGYKSNAVEEIVYYTNVGDCSPEDVILAFNGDKVIGYCWTQLSCETEADTEERKGRIFMLGVEPDFRGRGVGRGVLLAGLYYLNSKGVQVAELTVDSENEAACALYRSIGFKRWSSNLWYEKAVV
ncbi:GNAT family N-acetyltransferase [Chloroflexota bacterium]